jgi:hypothetical protein
MSQRDETVNKMKAQLDQWNAEIDRWEAKAREAQAGARAEYDRQLQGLRQHRDQAMYQLTLLQGAAASASAELMRGADEAWARMRDALEKAGEHFQKK